MTQWEPVTFIAPDVPAIAQTIPTDDERLRSAALAHVIRNLAPLRFVLLPFTAEVPDPAAPKGLRAIPIPEEAIARFAD